MEARRAQQGAGQHKFGDTFKSRYADQAPGPGITVNRRDFLNCSVAAAGIAVSGALPQMPDMPIIDTHQHLWDLKRFRLPWLKAGTPLARSHLLADYRKASAGQDIVGTVYMEVDVEPSQQQAEAEFVIETCRRRDSGMMAGVVSGRPATGGFVDYIQQVKKNAAIKGVRQVLHGDSTPPGYCLNKQFLLGVRALGELGLRFDICMRPTELPDAAKLVEACPETQFILDHCGNAPVHRADGTAPDRTQWRRDVETLASRPNVVCKVSGLVNTAKKGAWGPADIAPIVNQVLDAFGPGRVLFASDWPVCTTVATLAEWIAALKAVVADRPADQRRKLFHDNAVRVYGLT
jgi:L-fuconolactonase